MVIQSGISLSYIYKSVSVFPFHLMTLSVSQEQPALPINNQIKISRQEHLC